MRISDWSSDGCSSDLRGDERQQPVFGEHHPNQEARRQTVLADRGQSVRRHVAQQVDVVDEMGDPRARRVVVEDGEIGADQLVEEMLRSEEHTYELQSLMRILYAVFCLKKKTNNT